MTKFAHLADAHLGYQQYRQSKREIDFFNNFSLACDIIDQERADFVIFSGDLFHKPEVDASLLNRVVHLIRSKRPIPWVFVRGNHDDFQTHNRTSWISILPTLNKLFITDDVFTFRGLRVQKLDWVGTSINNEIIKILPHNGYVNILALHAGYVAIDRINDLTSVSRETMNILKSRFPYIAMGHIHQMWTDGIVHMPGSTEGCNTTEMTLPGGVWFWEDGKTSFIKIPKRPFKVIGEFDEITNLDETIVKLTYPRGGIKAFHIIKSYSLPKQPQQTRTPFKPPVIQMIDDASVMSPQELLTKYIRGA